MRGLTLITPPNDEPVTLEQTKSHLRVDTGDEDDYIRQLIAAARDHIESMGNIAFMTQTWDQVADSFPQWSAPMELYKYPVASIDSVNYTDYAGVEQVWPSSNYVGNLASIPPRIGPVYARYWPILALQSLASVRVRFVAGWTKAADVPPRLKQGLFLLCGHWYENREDVVVGARAVSVQIERALNEILQPFKASMYA